MDLYALINQLIEDGEIDQVAANNMAQFGRENRNYVGATILPERNVPRNMFRESAIRYRTVVAQDGGRYTPVQQRQDGRLIGQMVVELGDSDIGRNMTGQDYDALVEFLNVGSEMEAAAQVINWTDTVINQALVEHNERQRWNAIVDAKVVRKGDNGYTEDVFYPDPAGHRVAAAGDWTSDSYDPWADVQAMVEKLADKGFTVNRVITSTAVMTTLMRNVNVARRSGNVSIVRTGDTDFNEYQSTMTRGDLQGLAQQEGLPPFETYDLGYWTEDGRYRFLKKDVMVFVCETGRDEEYVNVFDPEDLRYVPETLGYTAVGRAVGQAGPGRVIVVRPETNTKPPRLEAEGWQTSLPVITEPEAIGVVNSITTQAGLYVSNALGFV